MQNRYSSAMSVSGMLTSHDLSCLSVSGGFPECSEVMILCGCQCLQASQGAPAWLLNVFGGSTSSCWRTLEALGPRRSLQTQDSSAMTVSGKLTSHDLSCLPVFGGFPECSEITIYRACRCLEASRMASSRVRELHKLLLEDLGGSWGLSELANQDSSALSVSGLSLIHI